MHPPTAFQLAQFDYALPVACIAQHPIAPRDHSRLMLLAGDAPAQHHAFLDLPQLLTPGDVLVVNRTQVIPARLHVRRPTGGRVELLLHTPLDGPMAQACTWQAMGRPMHALRPGARLTSASGAVLVVVDKNESGIVVRGEAPLYGLLQAEGDVPLPPYLNRAAGPTPQDPDAYQSIFAEAPGAVAAPTASLHFTPRALQALAARGIETADVVLHVGPGTFLPIRPEHARDVRAHRMHAEHYAVPPKTQATIAAAQASKRRVIAVGTTALRALETWAATGEAVGASTLFIYPGYSLRIASGLVTNFHAPRSTLLLLVSALAGPERILSAYAQAQEAGYRFLSYGDAMLILPDPMLAHG